MIRVVVEDEEGNEVSQGVDLENEVMVHLNDHRFSCLRFVDPYGDTVFNHYQVAPLLEDLRLLRQLCDITQHETAIQQVEALIERCQTEPHLYLKLIGD